MSVLSVGRVSAVSCIALLALLSLSVIVYGDESSATAEWTEDHIIYKEQGGNAVIIGTDLSSASVLTIPAQSNGKNVTQISEGALSSPYITSFALDGNDNFSVSEGVLFSKDGTSLRGYPAGSTAISYTIPAGTASVGRNAFQGSVSLQSVTLPAGLMTLHNNAFRHCTGLTGVTFPSSGLVSIGEYAFSGCTSLNDIAVPNSVNSIGKYAFSGCTGLSEISLGTGITSLPDHLFSGCSSLGDIDVPATVNSIGSDVFLGCSALARIDILCEGTVTFYDGSLRVGTNTVPVNGLYLNCVSPGLDPTDYSDTYTTFLLNQTEFHIRLYDGGLLKKDCTFHAGEDVAIEDMPTKYGYIAMWNPSLPETMPVGDIDSDVTWVGALYDITYRDPQSGDTYKQTVRYGDSAKLAPIGFEWFDKVFAGWVYGIHTYADRADVDDSTLYNGGSGATLEADLDDPAFIIRFDANGGTGTMNDQPAAAGQIVKLRLNAYERVGHIFKGWDYNGTTYPNGYDGIHDLANDGSVQVFVAEWEPIRYTVDYELEGGTGEVSPKLAWYGERFELPGQLISRTGYVQVGWSFNQGASTVNFMPSASVLNLSTTDGAHISLYAVWANVYLAISFKANGGTGEMDDQYIGSGNTMRLNPCTFQSENAFLGWARTADGPIEFADEAEMTFTGTSSEHLDLYAVWDSPSAGGGFNLQLALGVAGLAAAVGLCAVLAVRWRR